MCNSKIIRKYHMSNPIVSVVIPVYNAQEGIKQCLDSLLNQTFKDYEIILLNDGSTDNTLEVIKSYASKNDCIRVIDKENEGVAKTRNKGIHLAKGEYIVFIDNDDFVESDYLERFYNAIDQEQLDIVLGGYKRVNQDLKTLFKQDLTQSEWSKYIIVAPWARIYRTSFLIDNEIEFFDYPIGEDVIFTLSAYNLTEKIKIIDYNGYNWFFNEKSISNTSQRGFNHNIDIVYFLSHLLQVAGDSKYIRYFIKRYYIWYLLFSGRAASSLSFMDQYKKIKQWISKENIDSSLTPLSSEITGERMQTVVSVLAFRTFERLRLVSLFSKLYCKGKEKQLQVLMIIPAYNEEESIFDTVMSILNYRKKVDFELDYVVINDGSTDKTKHILEENHFNAVHLVMNLGIGGAVQTGYKYALEHDYDVAVQFDGDGQHDIESLSDLLEPIRKNEADLVIGSRFVGDVKSEFQTTFMRRFGISVISNLIKWTTGQRVLDTTSGYRLADKAIIKQFAKRYPIKYPEPETIVHILKRKYRVVEQPANMFERTGGVSSITPIKSIRYMLEVCSSIVIAAFMRESE